MIDPSLADLDDRQLIIRALDEQRALGATTEDLIYFLAERVASLSYVLTQLTEATSRLTTTLTGRQPGAPPRL